MSDNINLVHVGDINLRKDGERSKEHAVMDIDTNHILLLTFYVIHLTKLLTLQFLNCNSAAMTSTIKSIFRMWLSKIV